VQKLDLDWISPFYYLHRSDFWKFSTG